jgi:hypothetical protein
LAIVSALCRSVDPLFDLLLSLPSSLSVGARRAIDRPTALLEQQRRIVGRRQARPRRCSAQNEEC